MKHPIVIFVYLFVALLCWSCGEDGVEHLTLTDERDGQMYEVIKVEGVNWMAEDLRFNDNPAFSYQQALNACPPGWSMPTDEDWIKLCEYFGGYVYNGQDIGNPQQAYDRMVKEFNASEVGFYWTSSLAWLDAPSIRSSIFSFTGEVVEYGANLVTFKLPCRCIKREKEETSDVIGFQMNGSQKRYDFYSFQNSEYSDGIYFIVHRKVEGAVLVDRITLSAQLPEEMIGEGDPAIEATQASIANYYNDTSPFDGGGWILSTDEDLTINYTFYDGTTVRGTFSGTTDTAVGIGEGYFELSLD